MRARSGPTGTVLVIGTVTVGTDVILSDDPRPVKPVQCNVTKEHG